MTFVDATMRVHVALIAVALAASGPPARAFERSFESPAFRIQVPGIPDLPAASLGTQRGSDGILVRGRDGVFTVEISATASSQAGSTRACAGAFLRELVRRPDMPDRDSIYRAPFDTSTYLVLYILEHAGRKMLHAHVLAAVAGTHCIDAHFSRGMRDGEDEDAWRSTFRGSTIRDGTR